VAGRIGVPVDPEDAPSASSPFDGKKPKKRKKAKGKMAEIAKAVIKQGSTTLPKYEFMKAIETRALKKRLPIESPQQAFARMLDTDAKSQRL